MKVQEARADYILGTIGQRDWSIMTIEEIADINPRVDKAAILDDLPVSFVPMPAVGAADGSIRVKETRRAGEVKKGFTAFLEGDVLFAKITPCMENGKMAIVPKLVNGYGFGSTEFHVLRPKPGMDAKYIYYYVSSQAFRGEAERYMTGAVGQKRVSTTYLKQATIPVAPLDQQKRIVAEIEKQFSRLDEAVTNLKCVKANLKRYKAAVLKAAVEGRLVETEAEIARREGRSYETGAQLLQRILETRRSQWQGKGKYKEPAAPDTTDLPELPEGWMWATYTQIGVVTTGFTPPTTDPENFGGDIPFFKPTDLDAGGSVVLAREHLSEKGTAKGRLLPAGSVLVTCIGATIGKTGLARVSCATNQQINAITPNGSLVNSDFVYAWTVSPSGYKQILDNSSATTLPILNKSKFEALGVPLPPLAEQHRIVAEVDRRLALLRETEDMVDTDLRRAVQMRQSILASVFC
ncbi:MAG: restriction endonuclease subunit S [Vulcanimicrobiaceae bacterium]